MKDMVISYERILKYQGFLEREIENLAQEHRELCWKRTETNKSRTDRFSTDYGITGEIFKERTFSLRIRQFEMCAELMALMMDYNKQTGERLARKNYILRELINFHPGYDDFDAELLKMKNKRGY